MRSTAAQLATPLDDYRAAGNSVHLEEVVEDEPGSLFRRLLGDPLRGVREDGLVLVVVDGPPVGLTTSTGGDTIVLCHARFGN